MFPDLAKVFYSNMDISEEKKNRVITKVRGVLIDFDVSELNSILGNSDYGLEIFSLRKSPNLIVMFMLMPFEIYAGIMTFMLKIAPFIFALNTSVSRLGFCFVLFSPLYFLDYGIWMKFPTWMLL